MKIWYVLPEHLPDSLLFRQHQSIHAIMIGIAAGKPRRGITRFLKYGGFVAWCHYLSANEMRSRGANHESFLYDIWEKIPVHRRKYDYPVTSEMVARDKAVISAKMAASDGHDSKFRSTLPIHLAKLEFIEKQRDIITEGKLPPFALVL